MKPRNNKTHTKSERFLNELFPLFLSILIATVFISNNCNAQDQQKIGEVVFEHAIIPFTNITILDDTFSVLTTKNHPDKLILLQKDSRYIIDVREPLETDDYTFEIIWRHFNDSKTGIVDSSGTPLFGTYIQDFGEISTYYLRVYLKKPILEIGHIINETFKNSKSKNTFTTEPFVPLNVTTEIFNHGVKAVETKVVELIHKDVDVILPKNSKAILQPSGDEIFDKQIVFTENLEDTISFSYQLIPRESAKYTFKTKAYYTYSNRNYIVIERNTTILDVTSGIKIEDGFFNNKAYVLKKRYTDIGDENKYAIIIHNDNTIEKKVHISFQGSKELLIKLKQDSKDETSKKLSSNSINEDISISKNNKTILLFDIKTLKSGNYSLDSTIEYFVNEHKITRNSHIQIVVAKKPLEPTILFNSSSENQSAEVLMYLINPNKNSTVFNLNFTVESRFGTIWDSFSYYYPTIDIDGTFLINKFGIYIYNHTGDYVKITGSFKTAYGEKMFFSKEITPELGFSTKYYQTSAQVSESNNLDLRYEELMSTYNRKRPLTLSEKISSFSSKVIQSSTIGTTKNNYLIPVLVLISIVGIQIIQYLKLKTKQKK